jgi:hypothetical protein
VQSSIRRQFGLATDNRRVPAAEQGISEMMVDLYRSFAEPLSDGTVFLWLARRSGQGRGLGWSGLRFDTVNNLNPSS